MDIKKNFISLFEETFNESVLKIEDLKADGSNRQILRLISSSRSVIGRWGPDKKENRAFVEFSKHFKSKGFPVVDIYAYDEKKQIDLETDLGNKTLFEFLKEKRSTEEFPEEVKNLYKKALFWLSKFQTEGIKNLNLEWCYPRREFDYQSMMWDCNYFKYYFLKLGSIAFDEQALEDDFKKLVEYLITAPSDFFLYRDFQSRNIMVINGEVFFIDYQGGRKGYVAYDVASLIYDAKADIPPQTKQELVEYYLNLDAVKNNIDVLQFRKYFYLFVIIRLMQAMGAYGLRGFYEKKAHFLTSVPYVIKNLEWLLMNVEFPVKLAELKRVFKRIINSSYLRSFSDKKFPLNLRIYSFSYRDSIPSDPSGHGGGFVFDLRCLPNPARDPKFASMTGKDHEVKLFLDRSSEVEEYYSNVKKIILQAVSNYISRNFTELYVAFGCTGGRHRSVYMAERLYRDFANFKNVIPSIKHTALEKISI